MGWLAGGEGDCTVRCTRQARDKNVNESETTFLTLFQVFRFPELRIQIQNSDFHPHSKDGRRQDALEPGMSC